MLAEGGLEVLAKRGSPDAHLFGLDDNMAVKIRVVIVEAGP